MNHKHIQHTLMKRLGIAPPTPLNRTNRPLTSNELNELTAEVLSIKNTSFYPKMTSTLKRFGANILNPEASDTSQSSKVQSNALIVDATHLNNPSDFDVLYRATHQHIKQLAPCSRILIFIDGHQNSTHAFQKAIKPALEGFIRSLSKEVGALGTTANLICIAPEEETRFSETLYFLLSKRSAFISAQTFTVTQCVKDGVPLANNTPLAGKRFIVTGAARGIGFAIASALSREGAQVIGIDVPNTSSLHEHMGQINGLALELDITADDATEKLLDFLRDHTGAINGIIHNAGITRDKTIKHMNQQQWQSVMAVNLIAPITLTQTLLEHNMILDGGRIIGLSSISGIAGNAGQTNYALTKGGLAGYITGLADELANKNITANTIAPGFIETEMTAKVPFMVRTIGRRFNALKQGGLPEDVAELAVFLASDQGAGITGHNIRVCGHNLLGK